MLYRFELVTIDLQMIRTNRNSHLQNVISEKICEQNNFSTNSHSSFQQNNVCRCIFMSII